MNRALIFIFIFSFIYSNAFAETFELKKCFYPEGIAKVLNLNEDAINKVKWTNENFTKDYSVLKIKRDDFIKFLKWKQTNSKDPARWNRIINSEITKSNNSKKFKISNFKYVFPTERQRRIPVRYWSDKDLDKLKSLGAKEKKWTNDIAFSIFVNSSSVTELVSRTNTFIELRTQNYMYSMKIYEKNSNDYKRVKENFNELKKRYISRFQIDEYAGGIIIAYGKDSSWGTNSNHKVKLIIDLNNFTVEKLYGIHLDDNGNHIYPFNGDILKCTSSFQVAEENTDDDKSKSSGTAFFVSNKGHLITNNHVIEGCKLSKISFKNKDYNTKLLASDKTLDLALLKAELTNNSFINFSKKDTKKMQKIFVGGYPLGKGLSNDLKISSGIVSSLKGYKDNSNEIQIDAAINPGNSGGPIINENGELVGVAVSGMSKEVTEGINFGIKSSAAERFLNSNSINVKKSFFSSSKNNEELLNILEEGTVYTYCE